MMNNNIPSQNDLMRTDEPTDIGEEEKFCLSERKVPIGLIANYRTKDVKEFIRLLKEEFRKIIDKKGVVEGSDIKWILDKLAGEDLI